jgi:hypothetical protein
MQLWRQLMRGLHGRARTDALWPIYLLCRHIKSMFNRSLPGGDLTGSLALHQYEIKNPFALHSFTTNFTMVEYTTPLFAANRQSSRSYRDGHGFSKIFKID